MRTRGGTRGEPMARPFLLRRPRESGGADLRIVCYSPLSTLHSLRPFHQLAYRDVTRM
jgi:hypothetical protein